MKSYIEESNEIPELNLLRHKHDTELPEQGYDYQQKLFVNSVSPILYNNDTNEMFLTKLNNMMLTIVETILPTRNIFFYSHNKYFNRHGR